jgi:hypothetical protein
MTTSKEQNAEKEWTGSQMHALATELQPICRSITGDGVRETLRILQRHVPIEIHEVPTDGSSPKSVKGSRGFEFRNLQPGAGSAGLKRLDEPALAL